MRKTIKGVIGANSVGHALLRVRARLAAGNDNVSPDERDLMLFKNQRGHE